MTIESRRYALPTVVADEFEHRWSTALKKGRRSAAIGEMCRVMTAHLLMNVDYAGRDDHAARLLELLRGCQRIKWQAGDLRMVLDFLVVCEHQEKHRKETLLKRRDTSEITKLLEALASRARRQFPDNAFFQLALGELEMRKGPSKCHRSLARECFQRVLQLVQGANDPDSRQMVTRARENLDLLGETGALPFGPLGFDEGEEDGGLPAFSPGDSPEKLFAKFARVCGELGLDPQETLDRVAAGMPFRFPTKDTPSPTERKQN